MLMYFRWKIPWWVPHHYISRLGELLQPGRCGIPAPCSVPDLSTLVSGAKILQEVNCSLLLNWNMCEVWQIWQRAEKLSSCPILCELSFIWVLQNRILILFYGMTNRCNNVQWVYFSASPLYMFRAVHTPIIRSTGLTVSTVIGTIIAVIDRIEIKYVTSLSPYLC